MARTQRLQKDPSRGLCSQGRQHRWSCQEQRKLHLHENRRWWSHGPLRSAHCVPRDGQPLGRWRVARLSRISSTLFQHWHHRPRSKRMYHTTCLEQQMHIFLCASNSIITLLYTRSYIMFPDCKTETRRSNAISHR